MGGPYDRIIYNYIGAGKTPPRGSTSPPSPKSVETSAVGKKKSQARHSPHRTASNLFHTYSSLKWVKRVGFPDGVERVILLTDRDEPEHTVLKIADFRRAPSTSTELLSKFAAVIAEQNPGQVPRGIQVLLQDPGGIELMKYGPHLFCFDSDFFAHYDPAVRKWILIGVSDGRKRRQYFTVQHPPHGAIGLELEFGDHIYVGSVKPLSASELARAKFSHANDPCHDIITPRRSPAPPSAVLKMYFTKGGRNVFALTRYRIYLYREGEDCGFQCMLTTDPNDKLPPINKRFKIGAKLVMKEE